MFDGFDAMPLCVAPLLACLCTGIVIGLLMRRNRKQPILPTGLMNSALLSVAFLVFWGVCGLSLVFQIGTAVPSPWVRPFAWDVEGQWGLSRCTSKRFQEQWNHFSGTSGIIEFKNDGTFAVKDLPAFWLWEFNSLSEKINGEYFSGSGTWYFQHLSGRIQSKEWMLFAKFNRINDVPDNRVISFYFNGQLPPYDLAYSRNINLLILTKHPFSFGDGFCP